MFAVGEDGQLRWLKYRSGWQAPVTVGHDSAMPFVSTPAVVKRPGNGLEVVAMAGPGSGGAGMYQTAYDGSNWSGFVDGQFQILPDDTGWGFEGTPAVLSGAGGRVDVFSVARTGKLWWFYATNEPHSSIWRTGLSPIGSPVPAPLVASGATGDPLVLSRGAGQMELFYRTNDGRLAHMTYSNGAWGVTEYVLLRNAIR
jgi:hypothetical protein